LNANKRNSSFIELKTEIDLKIKRKLMIIAAKRVLALQKNIQQLQKETVKMSIEFTLL
jgi:hypothetical protein